MLDVWREHYIRQIWENDNKEGQTGSIPQEAEEEQEITLQEVEEELRNIKTGKAGGKDQIHPKMIRFLRVKWLEWIWESRISHDWK